MEKKNNTYQKNNNSAHFPKIKDVCCYQRIYKSMPYIYIQSCFYRQTAQWTYCDIWIFQARDEYCRH